jgi:FkbM family methyltransferase
MLHSIAQKIKTFGRQAAGIEPRFAVNPQTKGLKRTEFDGWVICLDNDMRGGLMYSFGVGDNLGFESTMAGKTGMVVHAFDPTPRSVDWVQRQQVHPNIHLHATGIDQRDGVAIFYPPESAEHVSFSVNPQGHAANGIELPVKRLVTIMKELEHSTLDVLKMDIEGAEYIVLNDIICSGVVVKQMLIEFHHRMVGYNRTHTEKAIQLLREAGYVIAAISSSNREFTFVRL